MNWQWDGRVTKLCTQVRVVLHKSTFTQVMSMKYMEKMLLEYCQLNKTQNNEKQVTSCHKHCVKQNMKYCKKCILEKHVRLKYNFEEYSRKIQETNIINICQYICQ